MTPQAASLLIHNRGVMHDRDVMAPRRDLPSRRVNQAAWALALIGVLSLAAREREASARADIGPDTGVAQGYRPSAAVAARMAVPDGAPRFALDGSDSAIPYRQEPARLDPATGRHEDGLGQGSFASLETPYLRLTVIDGPVDEAPALFVTMARRAADGPSLFVARTGERGRIDSRFGPLETLEARLTALSDGKGSRTCTGFTTRPPATIRIEGWLCAPLGQAPEPSAIACALDKLAPNGQASPVRDDIVKTFAQAKARHGSDCGASPVAAAHTGSIGRATKRQEASVRRNAQARP